MSDYIENPELNEEESNNVEQTMQDVLDEALSIEVGDTVKGEVLSIQDRQAIVGIIGGGVEGVI
ncbi:MAG TPA: 30S ribosomal protein S1, partial [Trichococcus flocculiformis]|nr:30S ribosomal protein S1 [Trichococcus flocculiformis]